MDKEKRQKWVDSLQPGDTVCKCTSSFYHGNTYTIMIVKRRTKARIFMDNGAIYTNEGYGYGSTSGVIQPYDDNVKADICKQKVRNRVENKIYELDRKDKKPLLSLSTEELENMDALLETVLGYFKKGKSGI